MKGNIELSRIEFRYIEHLLYRYEYYKKELEEFQENKNLHIIEDDPVYYKMLCSIVEGIERALKSLSETHLEIFKKKYIEGKSWQKICTEMFISDRTFFRLRREIVCRTAVEIGIKKLTPLTPQKA